MNRIFSNLKKTTTNIQEEDEDFFLELNSGWWLEGIKASYLRKRNIIVRTHYIWNKDRAHTLKNMYVFLVRYKKKVCGRPKKFDCEVYSIQYNEDTSPIIDEYLKELIENNTMTNIAKEMLILFLLEHQQYLRDRVNISI